MPELPEVETIARDLDKLLKGASIKGVRVDFPKIVATGADDFARLIKGAQILKVERLAKWLHFQLRLPALKGDGDLLTHLKMTGQFIKGSWGEGGAFPPHARVGFEIEGLPEGEILFYRDIRKFGRLYLFKRGDFSAFMEKLGLGPDPFQTNEEDFFRRVSAKGGRLKAVLLDQTVVSGLGNIYADEGLFAAGLSPLRPAKSLKKEESRILLTELRRILKDSIKARGSTVSNYQGLMGAGSYQNRHQVYGRGGEPCPRCHEPLEKTIVGGRGTVYCPHCQK